MSKRNWDSINVALEDRVDVDVQKHIFTTLEEEDEILNQWDPAHRQVISTKLIAVSHGK
jgi:hypothetical protein